MVRTTLGAEVDTTVTATGSEGVDIINLDDDTTVADGTADTKVVRPPTGEVYELQQIRFRYRATNGAGFEHTVSFGLEGTTVGYGFYASNPGTDIRYGNSTVRAADRTQRPADSVSQLLAPRGIRADSSTGYQIIYNNVSGADQTAPRELQLLVRSIQVGE
jgi:hypothetical protein